MSKVRVDAELKGITGGRVRIGGADKTLSRIAYYNGAEVADLAVSVQPLTASAFPTLVTGAIQGAGVATTNATIVTPQGGTGPYGYSWSPVSGTGVTVNSPTAATTTFSRPLTNGEVAEATLRCTVTDNLGLIATVDVNADFLSFGGPEP